MITFVHTLQKVHHPDSYQLLDQSYTPLQLDLHFPSSKLQPPSAYSILHEISLLIPRSGAISVKPSSSIFFMKGSNLTFNACAKPETLMNSGRYIGLISGT